MRKRLMGVDPSTLNARPAVYFELIDGTVHITYASEVYRRQWEHYCAQLPHPSGGLVRPTDGPRYWNILELTFSRSTFCYVDTEDPTKS